MLRENLASASGVVVTHSPAQTGIYIGSPSLAVLEDGTLLGSHDEFGPGSTEFTRGLTRIYRSTDQGRHWEPIGTASAFWATLVPHDGRVYLMGCSHNEGAAVVLRSVDGGRNWTEPLTSRTGRIRKRGRYHCAPVPVVMFRERIYRAWETVHGTDFAMKFSARLLTAPLASDWLDARNWIVTPPTAGDCDWLNGRFNGWLEGNVVLIPEGRIASLMRVDVHGGPEVAALLHYLGSRSPLKFDPENDFIEMPGSAKKFTVRFDPDSQRYWSIVNPHSDNHRDRKPADVRNELALAWSTDLRRWQVSQTILSHIDAEVHGYQYVDWQFDGEDIIALVRTAHDDQFGGADNFHDANFLEFLRVPGFRRI